MDCPDLLLTAAGHAQTHEVGYKGKCITGKRSEKERSVKRSGGKGRVLGFKALLGQKCPSRNF
jgi:hypothetical protein